MPRTPEGNFAVLIDLWSLWSADDRSMCHEEKHTVICCVVMPSHGHALFVQNADWPLEKLMRSWKGFTSRKINSLLDCDGSLLAARLL
jgi:hypothetical protein